jgi:hypothetical protein
MLGGGRVGSARISIVAVRVGRRRGLGMSVVVPAGT